MSNYLHSPRSLVAPTLFGAFPPGAQAALRAAGRRRSFAENQLVQQRGDEGSGFWLIDTGSVRVGQFDPEGAFNTVALLGPGDSFGELAALADQPRVVDAVAVGPADLLFVPATALERMLAADLQAVRAVIGALAQELQEALDLMLVLRRARGGERVAQVLANLSRGLPPPTRVRVSQQELADLVGTSRMTVNTELARLEAQDIVRRGYGWIEVRDLLRLRD